jgi:putative phosphoribosyl transferase
VQLQHREPIDPEGMYHDRDHAGQLLARELAQYAAEHPLVLAIPRGGIAVAAVVARVLNAELDVLYVRRLCVPGHEELALGAMADAQAPVVNRTVVESFAITRTAMDRVIAHERAELERRELALRGDRPPPVIEGRTVVLIDDGVVTGMTMRAAIGAVRARGAQRVVVAVPVAARETIPILQREADRVICPVQPEHVFSLGQFYEDFTPISSAFAQRIFEKATTVNDDVATLELPIPIGNVRIAGSLAVPRGARAVVAFAHGSGSGRLSPRNRFVAEELQRAGFATLLVDLLTAEEEAVDSQTQELRFDIELLAERTAGVVDWLQREPHTAGLPLGLFGASTGAAAALIAAARRSERVRAVVSRGGRPDLAEAALSQVTAPTLLIVGGYDHAVLELNRAAARRLRCRHRIEVVDGATHLFEEPGKLEQAAKLAVDFFQQQLVARDE